MDKFEIIYGSVNGVVRINSNAGDRFIVKSGAMISMSPVFDMTVKTGGFGKTIGRMFSGQSTFLQEYKARESGELLISPSFLGDIKIVGMDGNIKYRLGQNAFLASEGNIELNTKTAGTKGLFSGEGIFQQEVSGKGTIIICGYGAIHKVVLKQGERYIVDTNHLVLWNSEMKYTVEMIGNGIKSLASGEGYICNLQGPGEIWMQTKNPSYLVTPTT